MRQSCFTGASGNLDAVIFDELLPCGYTVNAVLRSLNKSKGFLASNYYSFMSSKRLSFTETSDMTAPGSFDEPISPAIGIIHVATSLACSDVKKVMIDVTWAINENIVNAVKKFGIVKRIVICGSIVSIVRLPDDVNSGKTYIEDDCSLIPSEEATANVLNAYQHSKTYAEQKKWESAEKNKPRFSLVVLLATAILGKSLQRCPPLLDYLGGLAQVTGYLFGEREKKGHYFMHSMAV